MERTLYLVNVNIGKNLFVITKDKLLETLDDIRKIIVEGENPDGSKRIYLKTIVFTSSLVILYVGI